jgi:hypothetical protein
VTTGVFSIVSNSSLGSVSTREGFTCGLLRGAAVEPAGYRGLHTVRGSELGVLLGGGNSTQRQDIETAVALAKNL